jgi:hypothetical protein
MIDLEHPPGVLTEELSCLPNSVDFFVGIDRDPNDKPLGVTPAGLQTPVAQSDHPDVDALAIHPVDRPLDHVGAGLH